MKSANLDPGRDGQPFSCSLVPCLLAYTTSSSPSQADGTCKESKSGEKHQIPSFQASIPQTAFAVGFQSVTDKRATFPFLVSQSNIIIINDMDELVGNKISTPY